MNKWMAGVLAALVAGRALTVEDGQFTREYSRLYTALVLGGGGLILLLVLALVLNLRRNN